ncbi:MAG: hypothetical protein CVU62_10400 [Deltaproteobacteria bacterium HGW-Deltaproteobacteria-2]|jgi:hypothetical protein|nr:MAG: hypothetical protein CVU62_10400 [Deltaproteobacteria bacterium HGW-Deltaproteobacteria-2]
MKNLHPPTDFVKLVRYQKIDIQIRGCYFFCLDVKYCAPMWFYPTGKYKRLDYFFLKKCISCHFEEQRDEKSFFYFFTLKDFSLWSK